jgi:hypothetical protein
MSCGKIVFTDFSCMQSTQEMVFHELEVVGAKQKIIIILFTGGD